MIPQCEEWACTRKAQFQHQGRYYCSDICAQQDSASRQGVSTKSTPKVASSTAALGGMLKPASAVAQTNESQILKTPQQSESEQKSITIKTTSAPGQTDEDTGSQDTIEISKSLEQKSENGSSGITRVVASVEALQSLNGARSDSMNLIDDSILHLHGLMKSVKTNVESRAKTENRYHGVDPQLVNAACNVAKQMGSMLKLKIKFHKEIRKAGEQK